jgi:hypothetical protein
VSDINENPFATNAVTKETKKTTPQNRLVSFVLIIPSLVTLVVLVPILSLGGLGVLPFFVLFDDAVEFGIINSVFFGSGVIDCVLSLVLWKRYRSFRGFHFSMAAIFVATAIYCIVNYWFNAADIYSAITAWIIAPTLLAQGITKLVCLLVFRYGMASR